MAVIRAINVIIFLLAILLAFLAGVHLPKYRGYLLAPALWSLHRSVFYAAVLLDVPGIAWSTWSARASPVFCPLPAIPTSVTAQRAKLPVNPCSPDTFFFTAMPAGRTFRPFAPLVASSTWCVPVLSC